MTVPMKPKKLKAEIRKAGRTGHPGARRARSDAPYLASEGQIPAGEQLLDPKGVGQRLILSPRTVKEMANKGRLPAYRVGISLRFKWVEVEQFITANCKVAAPPATNS